MYKNALVKIYVPIMAKNSEGTLVKTWGYKTGADPIETQVCDVQPARLTESQVQLYGISDREANTKKCFFVNSPNFTINNRAFIHSFFKGQKDGYFEIRGDNPWGNHGECLFVPIIGEASWIFNSNATAHIWDDNFAWEDTGAWND
jgi:hypothetical protein